MAVMRKDGSDAQRWQWCAKMAVKCKDGSEPHGSKRNRHLPLALSVHVIYLQPAQLHSHSHSPPTHPPTASGGKCWRKVARNEEPAISSGLQPLTTDPLSRTHWNGGVKALLPLFPTPCQRLPESMALESAGCGALRADKDPYSSIEILLHLGPTVSV